MTATAPKHLDPDTRRWWRSVVSEFVMESHHLRLLQAACEAWDRYQQARQTLATEGPIVFDRFGQACTHPAIAIERDSRAAFLRLVKALDLDVEPPRPGPGRPPRAMGGF